MKRTLSLLALAALVVAAFAPASGHASEFDGCGLTTLDGTIQFASDGTLECGPGQGLVVREELAPAGEGRAATRRSLTSFGAIADVQLADEESPLRGEWADKCPPDSPVSNSAFRPHETFVPHLLNAHIKALNAIAESGSPVLGDELDLVIGLGDLADNQQYNELRLIIDLFDGNKIVDPDSGNDPVLDGDGYDGVQGADPEGSGVPLPGADQGGPPIHDEINPLEDYTLLDLANEPFWAAGLNTTEGQIPWYSLPGNHDVKVQGTIMDDNAAWRHAVRRYAIGHIKVMDLAPDYQARLCHAVAEQDQVAFQSLMMEIVENPHRAGVTKVVPSDPNRMLLYRSDEAKETGDEEACLAATQNDLCSSSWVEEHFDTTGIPVGHGYETANRCTDENGALLARACYAFDHGIFRFIGLDTNPAEGLESGNIDIPQFEWLQRELRANSSSYYDEQGQLVQNTDGEDKLIVLFTHHTISSTKNTGTYSAPEEYGFPEGVAPHSDAKTGDDLKDLLLHHPNVILQASGHTHQNKVWAHEDPELGTGYWEINTSAIADAPHQSRTIEIADNGDGTLSIFGVVFDAAVDPDARDIHWTEDDHTDEAALAAAHGHSHDHANVNEDWLASFGREVGFYDPQGDLTKLGSPADRNVELLIRTPFALPSDEATTSALTYTGDTSGRIGRDATVAALLTTNGGAPLEGLTVTFQRGDQLVSAVTGADGVASTTLKVEGPKGGSVPIIVTFGGSGPYPPASIEVPFTATSGGPK